MQNHRTLLSEMEAADFLGCSPALLRKWRNQGGGPTFVRIGRLVRYPSERLAEFVNTNTVHNKQEQTLMPRPKTRTAVLAPITRRRLAEWFGSLKNAQTQLGFDRVPNRVPNEEWWDLCRGEPCKPELVQAVEEAVRKWGAKHHLLPPGEGDESGER